MIIEIACNNFQSCENAQKAGADRIELIENLKEGGCTPSFGMIKKVKEKISIPIYVMIRPRGGDFFYSQEEIDIMHEDILLCKQLKVDGIVFGVLTKEGKVNVEACADLLQTWGSNKATFHRALDRTLDIKKSMEDIINLGFERVLTSGGHKNVSEGKEVIKSLQEKFGNQITIMPGAGVTPENATVISDFCATNEIHATCKMDYAQEVLCNDSFSDGFVESKLELISELVNSFE
jgi:copper homeostasis protein